MLAKRTFQLLFLQVTMESDHRRQRGPPPGMGKQPVGKQKGGGGKNDEDAADLKIIEEMKKRTTAEANKFTYPNTTTSPRKVRTLSTRLAVSFDEECDYLAYYCMKAYDTGLVCGRTLYYNYETFKNYCMLDYVNCMERYEVWQVVYMGPCFNVTELTEYEHYEYKDDLFLDQMYVMEM